MMSTPTKPTATANQRWRLTGSFRTRADRATMNRGAEKEIAVDWVRGRRLTAVNPQIMPVRPTADRVRWAPGRRVRRTPKPEVRQM